jgi:nuclear transport factor 2 (NTF2) superfamily protein
MPSTDFNGDPLLILTAEEANWLAGFITSNWDIDEDCLILRRVARKARQVIDEANTKNRKS